VKKYENLKLENQILFPFYLCSKELIRRYSIYLEEIDLTYTQFIVMSFFWEKKTSNVKELGKIMLLDSSTLTPLLKKLESKELIKRERNAKDERNLVLTLTKKGEKLVSKAAGLTDKMRKELSIKKEDEQIVRKSLMELLSVILRYREEE
jgi:DNA-binding MarR family transcriptional regulator